MNKYLFSVTNIMKNFNLTIKPDHNFQLMHKYKRQLNQQVKTTTNNVYIDK